MQFGDNMIRLMASNLRTIEERFNLLQWIDRQNADHGLVEIDKFVLQLLDKARPCFGADEAGAFLVLNDRMVPFEPQELFLNEEQEKKIVGVTQTQTSENAILTDSDRGLAFFAVIVSPFTFFNIAIIFQSGWWGDGTSIFHDPDCIEFAKSVNLQCKLFLQSSFHRKNSAIKDSLLSSFFEAHLEIDKCFFKLTNLFARFLPTWSPGKIDPPPLVQILTYSGDKQSIVLRSTLNQGRSPAKTLLLEKTISGLFIEKEEASKTVQNFLYVDPTDEKYRDRYASYLFDEPARSELVIPLRSGREIIGLINLEHNKQNVFSDFHISLLCEGAKSLESFVNALIIEEREDRVKDIGVFYVLQKILTRMATTYQHKVGQYIATSTFSMETLEETLQLDENQQRQFARLKAAVQGFAKLTKNYNKDLPDFVIFGKIPIVTMTEQAISEFDPGGFREHGEIQFKLDVDDNLNDDEKIVFASALSREHIYNVLNNSVYAVRERLKSQEIDLGRVMIKIYKREQKDKKDKPDSFPFIAVCVEDNGGGMPEDIVSQIFNPGFSTKGGSGFGLAAALEYMTAIGGNMAVLENKPGIGSAIVFYFPIYTPSIHINLERSLNKIGSQEVYNHG